MCIFEVIHIYIYGERERGREGEGERETSGFRYLAKYSNTIRSMISHMLSGWVNNKVSYELSNRVPT